MRRTSIVVTALSLALLTGCAGGDATSSAPTPDAAATAAPDDATEPTATPTPTPDEPQYDPMPEPVRPDLSVADEATAVAAAEYFLNAMVWAYQTGDMTGYDELSHPECYDCASTREIIVDLDTRGVHTLGGGYSTVESSVEFTGMGWLVSLVTVNAPGITVDAEGERAGHRPEARTWDITMELVHENGQWYVRATLHALPRQ